jgi:hypothetical protein
MRSRRSENNGISGSFPDLSGKRIIPNDSFKIYDELSSLTKRLTLGAWKLSASISHSPFPFYFFNKSDQEPLPADIAQGQIAEPDYHCWDFSVVLMVFTLQ